MTISPQHPIEGVYQAREALEHTGTAQARADLAQMDWAAYGSALLGVLASLDNLTRVLVEQIDQTDRDDLYRQALRDHPHNALDRAVDDLHHLRHVLNSAVSDTHQFWSEAQHIQDDTPNRATGSD